MFWFLGINGNGEDDDVRGLGKNFEGFIEIIKYNKILY